MVTKYRLKAFGTEIAELPDARETRCFWYYRNTRGIEERIPKSTPVFDSWAQAHEVAVAKAIRRVEACREQYAQAQADLVQVEAMEQPK